jgi:hypothetical protein
LKEIKMRNLIRNLLTATVLVILAACAGAPVSPGVGMWDVSINTPVGEQSGVWTIAADGTGIMGSDLGDQAIEGIILEGNSISFEVDIDAGGQSLSLSFSGTVEGDTLSGDFSSDFGDFSVMGTRQ